MLYDFMKTKALNFLRRFVRGNQYVLPPLDKEMQRAIEENNKKLLKRLKEMEQEMEENEKKKNSKSP